MANTRNPVKRCVDCGDPFHTSATGKTVRCQECRAKQRKRRMGGGGGGLTAAEHRYITERFTCKVCGKSLTRGEAYKHRRETGHTF